ISMVFTRFISGDITFFPIPANEPEKHLLYKSTVPAETSETVKENELEAPERVAENINALGTFATETMPDGADIYINDMAPLPNNSGHYTIDACTISQFAQHVRAICNLPLRQVELTRPAVMLNILGEDLEDVCRASETRLDGFLHLYGKEAVKPKRKMGHMTFIAESLEQVEQQINEFQEAKQ